VGQKLGQGHNQSECYIGGGMHFNGVASRLTDLKKIAKYT